MESGVGGVTALARGVGGGGREGWGWPRGGWGLPRAGRGSLWLGRGSVLWGRGSLLGGRGMPLSVRCSPLSSCCSPLFTRGVALKCAGRGADAPGVHDFIPRSDGDFSAWAAHFAEGAAAYFLEQGLDESMILELQLALGGWNASYAQQLAALAAARGATQAKLGARERLETVARKVSGFIQAYPATTDSVRANLGITVKGLGTRHQALAEKAPRIAAEQAARLTHRLRFVPAEGTEGIKKPRGVIGAELYVALAAPHAPPPEQESDYRYVRAITRDGVRVTYAAEQAGLVAHYRARWLTRTGDVGGWSGDTAAMVAA